jgi:hypothetical protein
MEIKGSGVLMMRLGKNDSILCTFCQVYLGRYFSSKKCWEQSHRSLSAETESSITVERRSKSALVDNHLALEHGQEVGGLLALNHPDLDGGPSKPVVQLNCLEGRGTLLIQAGVGSLKDDTV